jgi:hypothetical protein
VTNTVYPIGYSAGGAQDHIEQLLLDPKVLLIDTRHKPYSWRESWCQEALEKKYPTQYKWAGAYLGNVNHNNGLPIQIANPRVGIHGLQTYLNEGYDLILVCQCPSYESCHRKKIVELLQHARPDVQVVLFEQKPAGPTPEKLHARVDVLGIDWAWLLRDTLGSVMPDEDLTREYLGILNTRIMTFELKNKRRETPKPKNVQAEVQALQQGLL